MFGLIRKRQVSLPAVGDIWVFKQKTNPLTEIKRYKIIAIAESTETQWKKAVRLEHIQSGKCYDVEYNFFISIWKPEI